jgi:predicted GNAT family N-acyltransferase
MKDLEIRQVKTNEELNQVFKIRKQVFIKEQNVPFYLEMDGLDSEAEHVIAFLDDMPIGCARIRTNDCIKLERIAILKEYRKRGFGKQLTEYLINYCKRKKYNEICLHSQTFVSDFYEKLGFKKRGNQFLEAGIEHVEMYMKI